MTELLISALLLVQTLLVCHMVKRLCRRNFTESTSIVIREIPKDAISAMCQSILDETERLKICEDEKERCSIRNYLKEMSILLVECNCSTDNQEGVQDSTQRPQKESK